MTYSLKHIIESVNKEHLRDLHDIHKRLNTLPFSIGTLLHSDPKLNKVLNDLRNNKQYIITVTIRLNSNNNNDGSTTTNYIEVVRCYSDNQEYIKQLESLHNKVDSLLNNKISTSNMVSIFNENIAINQIDNIDIKTNKLTPTFF